ncbi:multicopper oxidase domain-containing protein [Alicyclobacillus sendaiensis]|uniref:multicopper oxidase domain-containing protein n=1 Tax=Alicyclobacillus sendaiensis TaxID=192387 RepID=UPI0007823755|nr:multicopper oxidase domain-containing protein [Alicyclobacillus sendaiensis]
MLKNELNEPTTLNFPGLPLPASQLGIGGVTQRPIPPGGEGVYRFTVTPDMVGTHLYESGMCYHAMHVHETTFWLLAEDGRPLPKPRPMNVLAIAPGETADVEFVADVRGDWMFHCHILDHMMNPDDEVDMMGGLVTFIHVK